MTFQNPLALFLLLLLIPFIWIGRPARGYGRGRERSALLLRVVIVVLLVLGAAGLELQQGSDSLAVVFLVDVSDSMPEDSRSIARTYIQTAMNDMRPEDQAAVILFGSEALIERTMSPDKQLTAFTSIPDRTQTDYAEAIRLAMALYPGDRVRRMVLLTDGRQTTGDALAAARLSVDSGVAFFTVPLTTVESSQEITLLDVDMPNRLIEGESFDMTLTVHARESSQIILRVLAGGVIAFEGTAGLDPGTQDFRIPLLAGDPGFSPYTVQIAAADDGHFQNNRLTTFARIEGPPKVLVVAPEPGGPLPFTEEVRPDESAQFISALEGAGFSINKILPNALPFELALLSEYASIVLVNVPGRSLSQRQMNALQSYVRDLGGGLLAIGGSTSYGVGGYFRTTLEEILPVDMEIKDQERRPGLTMVFIIDRSGSMSDSTSGVTKLELAKEAAIRSVELLFPGDKVGIIAFDDTASWVVPITDLMEPDVVINSIQTIGIGGGTDILAGLSTMANELPEDDSQVKHVILLTDGGASPIGIPNLVESLYQEHGITLTTVGVGSDAAPFLEEIAILGGGRYHFTDRAESIPSIFTEETSLATRSYIIEESFFPALVSRSTILSQISAVPPLHGYVAATAKSTAQTILVSDQNDPILSVWQYGLGKTIAWTSDASPRWSRDWVNWDNFQNFWTQAVRFTVSDRDTSPLLIQINEADGRAVITLDGITDSGEYLNGYSFSTNIVTPDGEVIPVVLTQVEPGRYLASFEPRAEGAYLLRFDGQDASGENTISDIAGWVRSYSPEYRYLAEEPDFLPQLAEYAGGQLLNISDANRVFANPEMRAASARPLWPELLIAALILLPFDIGVRRLALERRDFERAWQRVRTAFVLRQAPAVSNQQRPERMSSLLRAKDRAEQRRQEAKNQINRKDLIDVPKNKERVEVKPAHSSQESQAPKAETDIRPKQDTSDKQSTTAALLAGKRAREKRDRNNKNE